MAGAGVTPVFEGECSMRILCTMLLFVASLSFAQVSERLDEYYENPNLPANVETPQYPEVKEFSGNPNYWRAVRSGEMGATPAFGAESGTLINVAGMTWEELRNVWVGPFGVLLMLGVLGAITLFYFLVGKIKLSHPRTGKKIQRWTDFERAMHWTTAISFVILGISGVLLFFGKHFLKPVLPLEAWGMIIYASKVVHNYIGPIFVIGLVMMLVKWTKNNYFNAVDWQWFKAGGGMVAGGKHPDAGFCNGGEKVWFWLIATVGIVVCITGLIMDFPMFGQTRDDMQIANLVHGLASLVLFAASFGHIYIGTAGTEGAFEGMATGYVDESWAKQHHNLWFNDLKEPSFTPAPVPAKKASVSVEEVSDAESEKAKAAPKKKAAAKPKSSAKPKAKKDSEEGE